MQLAWIDDQPGQPSLADLADVGVHYERLDVGGDAYQPSLDALKRERGYVEQDVVALSPETPELDALCAKFADEHLHTDDEVRFVLEGEGIFDLRSKDDTWMRVTVEAGDLIVVPANLHHRFFLTDKRAIRCVRLFKDASGWVPHYREPQGDA